MDYSFELVRRTTPINIKEICRKFENVSSRDGQQLEQGKHLPNGPSSKDTCPPKSTVRPMLGPKPNLSPNAAFRNVIPSPCSQQNYMYDSKIPVRPARTRKNSAKKKHVDEVGNSADVGERTAAVNHNTPVYLGGNALHSNNEKMCYRTRMPSLSVSERKKLYEELENTVKTNGNCSPRTVQNFSQFNSHNVNGCQVTYAIPIKFSESSGRYRRSSSLKGNDRQDDYRSANVCRPDDRRDSVENGIPPPRKPPRTFAHDKYLAGHNSADCKFVPRSKILGSHKVRDLFKTDAKTNGKFFPHIPPKPNFAQAIETNGFRMSKVPCDYATPMKRDKLPKPNAFFDYSDVALNHRYYGTLRRSFSEEHVYEEPSDSIPTRAKRLSRVDSTSNVVGDMYRQKTPPHLHYLCVPLIDLPDNDIGSSKTLGPHRKKSPLLRFNSPKSGKSSLNNIRDVVNQSFVQLWRRLYPHGVNGDNGEHDGPEDVGADSGSEVSMKDVQERIIYVRSLRKQVIGTPTRRESSSECDRLFNSIFISCLPAQSNGNQAKPRLMFKFPKEQKDTVYDHSMIPQLSFPDYSTLKPSTAYKSEIFTRSSCLAK